MIVISPFLTAQCIQLSLTSTTAMRLILVSCFCFFMRPFGGVEGSTSSNCQRLSTINYHYSAAYHLPSMDADKTDVGVTFNFSVRAVSNGHLRLSSTPDAKQSAVTFEVVLGAGGNTFSAVRRKPKKSSEKDYSVTSIGLLSDKEMRPFSLVLKGETLYLYSNSSDLPLMVYEDAAIIDMEYVSFGAWNNVIVEWSFDCRGAEVPEPEITDPLVKLRRQFWLNYDPFNPPVLDNSTLEISVSMAIIRVNLNAKKSEFTLRGKFHVEWVDQKLQWNPQEYGNITHLNFKHRVIWMPEFELLDMPKADSSVLEDRAVGLYHNGAVRWTSLGEVQTWCDVDVTDWPSDSHTCNVHIGLRSHPDFVRVVLTETPQELESGASEWEITSITQQTLLDAGDAPPQSFKLGINVKRSSVSYSLLFIMPLFVAFIMLIMSFIIAPHHKTRLTLVTASILTLHVLLYTEDMLLPALPQSTPHIMKVTSSLLLMAILQLIFHCFNAHIAKMEVPPPQIVKKVAKRPWMKYLHQATYKVFLAEKQDGVAELSDVPLTSDDDAEPSDDVNMNKYHWTLISRGLDTLNFTLSFLILPFLLARV